MIQLPTIHDFESYQLLDSGNGERLEKFGEYIVRKPDPQCLWKPSLSENEWRKADAVFEKRGEGDKGEWKFLKKLPSHWEMSWKDIKFWVEPTPFKHLGVFPEQAVHWEWMEEKIRSEKRAEKVRVLNLFGYTGISSVVCAKAGAFVTHVDGSKPSLTWARENMLLSGLPDDSVRWILEDVMSFVKREVRRGTNYDGIIMDPPVFGHGAKGEVWKFQEHFPELMEVCAQLLSDKPVFCIVNAYAVSASALMLQNVMEDYLRVANGKVSCGELVLTQSSGRQLSTGIYGRWSV